MSHFYEGLIIVNTHFSKPLLLFHIPSDVVLSVCGWDAHIRNCEGLRLDDALHTACFEVVDSAEATIRPQRQLIFVEERPLQSFPRRLLARSSTLKSLLCQPCIPDLNSLLQQSGRHGAFICPGFFSSIWPDTKMQLLLLAWTKKPW